MKNTGSSAALSLLPSSPTTAHTHLYIAESPGRGRGVYSTEPIRSGELVEECIALVISHAEGILIDKNVEELSHYQFAWNEENPDEAFAFVLGYGSLYNHASPPNIICKRDFKNKKMRFLACRDIAPHEELTFDYDIPLWFEAR